MDLSSTPTAVLKIIPEVDRVFVYVDGQPPLILTHDQIHQIWLKATLFRADLVAALGEVAGQDGSSQGESVDA